MPLALSASAITQGRNRMASPARHNPDTARNRLRFHLPPDLQRLRDLDSLRLAPNHGDAFA
ncbi:MULTISPECIES: Rpn family recombination-promoting nuclease/putative transposase [unclassified Paludibacterium]|uniref:Rpn family recombination-promoting nuclease/putative transposase n=1 Tax=unclassified Paludibacterium TaxID=2618429 RepID=UPI001C03B4BC|nr:Rpn family recombination-promoting nuclease/putative transposase [Paludibacterium sp. B53371]BEV71358.1 hypothetical protein THUN1379_08400 [Paludibacterium sp. THUN1379]